MSRRIGVATTEGKPWSCYGVKEKLADQSDETRRGKR